MKKIVSILAIVITVPSFATDITGSSDCDNTTLGTYSAPVDMEAKWTANTINLQWYDDANDSTPTNTMCTYNTTIALPTEPSKPGYNFTGWALRSLFDLSTLNINTDGISYTAKNFAANICWYNNVQTDDSISDDCTEPIFTSLNPGEWEAAFGYGTVQGISLCSTQGVTNVENMWYLNNNTFTPDHFATTLTDETGQNGAIYCWCKPTGFAEPNSSIFTNVASRSWVLVDHYEDDPVSCAETCVMHCAGNMLGSSDYRQALYGITQ